MTEERYQFLMDGSDEDAPLTPEEIALGWHFCFEFDGLLVGPDMHEQQYCNCL